MGEYMVNISRKSIFLLLGVLCSLQKFSNAEAATLAEDQTEQINQLLVELNKSSKEVADDVISTPQTASDAGCLDGIQGIDLSVFSVDFANIWGALYNTVKDQIVNSVCEASSDWVNDQASVLDTNLEAPLGLGSITIDQGSAINDWQSVVTADVELSNAELATQVTTDTLGQVPAPSIVSGAIKKAETSEQTPGHDKEQLEEELENMLDIGTLFEDQN